MFSRRPLARLLLILAAGSVALLVCEVLLRVSGYSSPNFYLRDPVAGAALRPNAEGWWTREGRDYVRINSQGLRDREHAKAKPANTVRVAVLGDSYAEALQLPMEKAFWAVAEAKLQACPAIGGRPVEAINFAVSGYGTAQQLLTLRHKVWDYDPDIVLLAMTTRNDVGDNSRAIKQSDDIPYFELVDGRLVLDDAFLHTRQYRWQHSALPTLLRWVRTHVRVAHALNEAAYRFNVWWAASSRGGSWNLASYKEPRDHYWRDAWAVTEALVVRMRDEVEERQARFFVATLSGPDQVYPDPQVRREVMKTFGVEDLLYPDLRVKQLCERERIPVLILSPEMQNAADRQHIYFHGFDRSLGYGHWNERGHRAGGEMIADWLCQRLTS